MNNPAIDDADSITETKENKISSVDPAVPPMIKVVNAVDIKNPWICQSCGAILGSVYHEKIRQGLSLSRLILFRGAIKLEEQMPENFVFGKVDAGEFGCSRCGTVRQWHPSPEALRYMAEPKHIVKRNRNT